MNKLFLTLVMVVAMGASAFAATNNVDSKFNKNELSVKAFGTYTDSGESKVGGGFGVQAFPLNKYLGLEASTTIRNNGSAFFDSVNALGVLRVPVKSFAPYAIGGIRYNLDRNERQATVVREASTTTVTFRDSDFDWVGGGGVEYRVTKRVGLFADYQRLIKAQRNQVRAGLNFTF
jgi:opacity protein-like surface antigen